MKKIKSFTVLLSLISFFMLTSCEKGSPISNDNNNNNNNNNNKTVTENQWSRSKLISYTSYENDGVTEQYRQTFTYDSQGRESGFTYYYQGKLTTEYKSYSYSGNECTYTYNLYNQGSLQTSNKVKVKYYDEKYNRGKLISYINYENDGVTEQYKQTYTYDSQGRESGFTYYYQGKLTTEYKNYSYSGNECTYTYNFYNQGSLQTSNKVKVKYYDDKYNRGKLISYTNYENDGLTEQYRQTFTYDSQGRESGFTYYYQGKLTTEYKSYSYSEKECIYTYNSYNQGNLQTSNKVKVVYY